MWGIILIFIGLIISAIYQACHPKDYFTISFEDTTANSNNHNTARRIDGRPPASSDDWDRYWVKVGLSDGYSARLSEIEDLLKKRDTENAKALYDEWKYRYEKYSSLCRELGIYNYQIGIREPYNGAGAQKIQEQLLLERIEALFNANEIMRTQYEASKSKILNYLLTQPYHRAMRSTMLNEISNGNKQLHQQLSSDYKFMVKDHILIERKEPDGKYSVIKAPTPRKKKEPIQTASVYRPEWYAQTTRKTEYKVEYTVALPKKVNAEKRTGEFISISRNERYFTSLESCTCPSFHGQSSPPCKHMVALANHLGFYKPGIGLIKIHEEAPIFDMSPEPDVVQTEPPSTKREDRETRQKTRNTNSDTTIEKPASTPKAAQPQGTVSSDMRFDEFISMLKANNILFVDKTANNGCLWVECTKQTENLSTLSVDGIHPKKAGKTRHFDGQPGWYLDRK